MIYKYATFRINSTFERGYINNEDNKNMHR